MQTVSVGWRMEAVEGISIGIEMCFVRYVEVIYVDGLECYRNYANI